VIRRLVALLAIVGAWWLARRVARSGLHTSSATQPHVPRFEGAMVRDRICQTFLPRSRALVTRIGTREHYFCSEACRSAFLRNSPSS
jgi:YHS domain-containing protein